MTGSQGLGGWDAGNQELYPKNEEILQNLLVNHFGMGKFSNKLGTKTCFCFKFLLGRPKRE